MSKINFQISIPTFLENIAVFFLLRYRKKRYGLAFRKIKLYTNKDGISKDIYAIVDQEDYEKLAQYCWQFYESPKSSHSAVKYCNGQITYMHRLIMNATKGDIIDHKNRNSLDNTKRNLRFTTASQNACNRKQKNGSSQYKGVRYVKETRKWRATIMCNGKRIHLGCFKNEQDAAKAYDEAAKKYHKEFAVLNFG